MFDIYEDDSLRNTKIKFFLIAFLGGYQYIYKYLYIYIKQHLINIYIYIYISM